jgi:hypothetical protein
MIYGDDESGEKCSMDTKNIENDMIGFSGQVLVLKYGTQLYLLFFAEY